MTHSSLPREKLLLSGTQTLSMQELLMILIGTGTKKVSVSLLAKRIANLLQQYAPSEITKQMLLAMHGIGTARACMVLAVLELSERLHREQELTFNSPEIVRAYLYELHTQHKEMMICLYLSARHTLVHKEILSIGSLNQTIIEPRDVFSPIKQFPVSSIILSHNHPSGNPKPSEEDITFTKRIAEACILLGVELLDHLILTGKHAYSLKEHGYL